MQVQIKSELCCYPILARKVITSDIYFTIVFFIKSSVQRKYFPEGTPEGLQKPKSCSKTKNIYSDCLTFLWCLLAVFSGTFGKPFDFFVNFIQLIIAMYAHSIQINIVCTTKLHKKTMLNNAINFCLSIITN